MKTFSKYLACVSLVALMPSSCSDIPYRPDSQEGLRVSSMRERSILLSIKLDPRGLHAVDVNLWPYNDADFARFKRALGVSDAHVYARGTVRLELLQDGRVQNVVGNFEVQVGKQWKYIPEVRKVPTFRPDKKLTMEILQKLSAKGLL